jgi:metal-responsive CopG/Arc/MetJ family transcriptional regulator
VSLVTEVTVATKIGSEELKRIDAIVRRRGLLNRSDFVKEAIWLYLSLSSLETEARLRMLRLINESVGVSGKSARQLIEEARKDEDI